MNTNRSPLLLLPRELRDQIYEHLFAVTPYDYAGTRKAELRIYDDQAVLRRTSPCSPPRWKGCRNVMRACKQLHLEIVAFLYGQMAFETRISGNGHSFPNFSRLTSEYPIGRLDSNVILRHAQEVEIYLDAWSFAELDRLKFRLHCFLRAAPNLDVRKIYFEFDDRSRWTSEHEPIGTTDEIAEMLGHLRSKTRRVEVFNPSDTFSKACFDEFLRRIEGYDCTHVC